MLLFLRWMVRRHAPDFALCRLGILDLCSRKRRKENCDVCRFPVQ